MTQLTDRHLETLPGWRGDMPLGDRANETLVTLRRKSPALDGMVAQVPIAETLRELLVDYDARLGYSQLKPGLEAFGAHQRARFDAKLVMQYGLALLVTLIGTHRCRWGECILDAQLEPEFIDSFHRLLTAASRGGAMSLSLGTDAYAKELAICLYRLIPAGGQMIDPGAGVPRSIFLKKPSRTLVSAAGYLWLNAHGRRPFAEFHTNLFQRQWFTAPGWDYAMRTIPAIFRSCPALKGLTASSWFFDPALPAISPELAFVSEFVSRWGGALLPVVDDPHGTSGALSLSPIRQELFNAGEYVPRIYRYFISKKDILSRVGTLAPIS